MKRNQGLIKFTSAIALMLVSSLAISDIQLAIDVSTSTNTPEAAVKAGFDEMCPKIQGLVTTDSGLLQLQGICAALAGSTVGQTEQAYRGMSARSNTSTTAMTNYGPSSMPLPDIGKRLAALRKAAENSQSASTDIEFNGRKLPHSLMAELFGQQTGGGASADAVGSRWSGFASAMSIQSEQSETQTLAGFKGNSAAGIVGVDYQLNDQGFVGVAGRVAKSNVDLQGNAGTLDAYDTNITFYETVYLVRDWYLEGTANISRGRFSLTRNIDFSLPGLTVSEIANSDTHGKQFGASLGTGTEWAFSNGFLTQFTAGLYYTKSDIEAYTETGANGLNLSLSALSINRLQSHVGTQLTKTISFPWGVLIPQFNLTWINEFNQDGEKIQASLAADPTHTQYAFTTDDKDANYFTVGLGMVTVMPGGLTGFIQGERYLKLDNFTQTVWSIGARMEF